MYKTEVVSPLSLQLDQENPRFKIKSSPEQDEIRNYMLTNENVLDLAQKIVRMDVLLPGERVIILKEDSKNIVLEGNRRTAVYQMLLKRSLIPQSFARSFPYASESLLAEIKRIPVDIVNNRDEAMAFLAARHIEGVKQWSSISKWRVAYEYFEKGKSLGEIADQLYLNTSDVKKFICNYKLLRRGLDAPNWNEQEKEQLSILTIEPDKLIRILRTRPITQLLGLYFDSNYQLVSNSLTEEKLDELIIILTRKAFIENTINTRTTYADIQDIIDLFLPQTPDGNGSGQQGEDNSDSQQGDSEPTSDGQSGNQPNGPAGGGFTGPFSVPPSALPYFFTGLDVSKLSNEDASNHGLLRICREILLFSNSRSVYKYPISAAFLTRSLIEQALIYYAKTHNILNQDKTIWSQVTDGNEQQVPKLSRIIEKYRRSLPNYILDNNIRDYFTSNFDDYGNVANPLNWVVHRPWEFVIDDNKLCSLPHGGLLAVINYLIS